MQVCSHGLLKPLNTINENWLRDSHSNIHIIPSFIIPQLYSLKVDRLEKPKRPEDLRKDGREDWTGCQADAIEHLCTEVGLIEQLCSEVKLQSIFSEFIHIFKDSGQKGI